MHLSRPSFSVTALLGCIGLLVQAHFLFGQSPANDNRPNILFILADDLGWKDLSCAGSRYYETPNLDRLAAGGVYFTRGYANCQVCSPSRASYLTGKFPARHGITDWIGAATGEAWNRNDRLLPASYVKQLPASEVTFASVLQEAGYRTFFAGKWHLGGEGSLPQDHGFQINKGGHHRGSPPGGFFAPYKNPFLEDGPAGESLTLRLAAETAAFIEQTHREEQAPFLAYLSFYTVHSPIQTTRGLWRIYQQKTQPMPAVDHRFVIDRTTPVRQVQDCPVYAGMIETLDDAVGMVMQQLQQLGIADNTIIVFTSDNGGVSAGDANSTSNLPLRGGKGRQWEGGIRVPFIVKAPGVSQAGLRCDHPVTGADFYPTFLELAGLPLRPEQHADGRSLVGLLRGETMQPRPLVWHYPHYGNQGGEPSSILRLGDWKLIHYHEDDRVELYDLSTDPQEQHDRSGDQPERTASLQAELTAYLTKVGAKFPRPDSRFDPEKKRLQQQRIREVVLPRLEKQHAHYLDDDFSPNRDWWGSLPDPS